MSDLDEKLSLDKFRVDEGCPHIVVRDDVLSRADAELLVKGCPAGLYRWNDDFSLRFDYAGCLECGLCRVLGSETVLESWNYPQGTMGVEYRYG